MADVVRASDGERWEYLPVGSEAHLSLLRFADNGMASIRTSEVRLTSESGPIFWDMIDGEEDAWSRAPSFPVVMSKSMVESGVQISRDEQVVFGKRDEGRYGEYMDMTLLKDKAAEGAWASVSSGRTTLDVGDIVLTAWPKSKDVLPATVSKSGFLELVESADKDDRCLVFDESGAELITASFPSNGTENIRTISPSMFSSWLFSVGSKASRSKKKRFTVEADGQSGFRIDDRKTKRAFRGELRSSDESEIEQIEFMLHDGGLGSVLGRYELKRA